MALPGLFGLLLLLNMWLFLDCLAMFFYYACGSSWIIWLCSFIVHVALPELFGLNCSFIVHVALLRVFGYVLLLCI